MRKLVERGAAIDGIKFRDRAYVNPMMECIYVVHRWNALVPNHALDLVVVRLVNFLLSLQADPNANSVQPLVGAANARTDLRKTAPEGLNTPLLMCARFGYVQSVRALLKGGADPLKKYAIHSDNPLFKKIPNRQRNATNQTKKYCNTIQLLALLSGNRSEPGLKASINTIHSFLRKDL
jgi:ankyrin repeat protein